MRRLAEIAFRAVLRVDLTGVFLTSREASRAMKAQQSGRISNIASVLGLVPMRLGPPDGPPAAPAARATGARAMAIRAARLRFR